MLGISVRTVEYLLSQQKLVSRRIGRRVLVPFSSLESFAQSDHPQAIPTRKCPPESPEGDRSGADAPDGGGDR